MTRVPARARASLFVVLLLAVLAAGCSQLPRTHYYVLELESAAKTNEVADNDGRNLAVRHFEANSPYDQDRLAYRVGEGSPEISFYTYHRWAAPLEGMLEDAVAVALEGTPGVRTIEPIVSGRQYDAYLDGRLLQLEEIDRAGEQRILLRLSLRLRTAAGEELWSEVLEGEGTTQTDRVVVIVETMRAVLEKTLADARPRLARALRQAPPG